MTRTPEGDFRTCRGEAETITGADKFPIALRGITNHYGRRLGVRDLTMRVRRGEIMGLLGPEGAGKTTTLRLLLGLLRPGAGTAMVLGLDPAARSLELRRRVGYVPARISLYEHMSARRLLEFSAGIRGGLPAERTSRLVDRLRVDLDARLQHCSDDARQRTALILAMAHDPEVLILDEPTSNLDTSTYGLLFELLRDERRRGKTILLSSSTLVEAEALCDRVTLLKQGHVIAMDDMQALSLHRHRQVNAEFRGELSALKDVDGVSLVERKDNQVRLLVRGDIEPLMRTLPALGLRGMSVGDPDLEESFLTLYREDRVL